MSSSSLLVGGCWLELAAARGLTGGSEGYPGRRKCSRAVTRTMGVNCGFLYLWTRVLPGNSVSEV